MSGVTRTASSGLLGDSFGLEVERRTWWATGRNGPSLALLSTSAPPLKALLGSSRGAAAGSAERIVDLYERYRDRRLVRYPNDYLLRRTRRS